MLPKLGIDKAMDRRLNQIIFLQFVLLALSTCEYGTIYKDKYIK